MYRDEKTDQSPNKYFPLFLRGLMTLIGLFISEKNVSHHPVTVFLSSNSFVLISSYVE